MIAEVAEQQLRDLVAGLAVQGQEHAGAEIGAQQVTHLREVHPGEGRQVLQRGGEAERGGELQQETEVVIGIVPFQRIQGQDGTLEPGEETLLAAAVPDGPVQHLAHEEGHRALGCAGAQANQRIAGREAVRPPEVGFRVLRDLGVQHAQGLEKRHPAALGHGRDETAAPPVGTEGVQDQGSLPDLGGIQDDQLCAVDHQYWAIRSLDRACRSVSS